MVFPKDPGPPDYGAYLCSPAELKASYHRCRALRVPPKLDRPQQILPKTLLDPRLAKNAFLLTAAGQVITPRHYAGAQKDHIYILCDPELVTLKIFAASEILVAAEEVGVKPGTVFTEASCGTNALALAREHHRLLAIRGEQHYCKLFKNWWCVASPVKNPAGRTIGFLDISMHAERELVSTIALLQTLVESIEDKLSRLSFDYAGQRTSSPPPLLPEMERELSPRQREILRLLASGLANKEIAKECSISIETVKTHCRSIYRRIGIRNPREFRRKIRNRHLKPESPV